jgi:SAM-dependent methyltransferase
MLRPSSNARARRALERQLEYQRDKAVKTRDHLLAINEQLAHYTRLVRSQVGKLITLGPETRVLEVGSGAHGLVFFWGEGRAVGVDPLAAEYLTLFPDFQSRAPTIAALGEALPFADESFDVVLCDNVVDHAGDPAAIVSELARVLVPSGVLFFTVNVHHRAFRLASHLYESLPIRVELSAFADHTYHFTLEDARALVEHTGLHIAFEDTGVDAARSRLSGVSKLLYRNARYQALATK